MQIGMLGPLELRTDAGEIREVPGPRLRRLVIALALRPGRLAPIDYLVDAVWAEQPPADPSNAVQALVYRLRRAAPELPLVSRPGGYVLDIAPGQIDAWRFQAQVTAAPGGLPDEDPATTAKRLREALDLWRGDAFEDAGGAPVTVPYAARLDELRLAAWHDRMSAELDAGPAAPVVAEMVVAEMEELVSAHPLRESFAALLMRAQRAAGDRAGALRTYADARERLVAELGVEPSGELAAEHLRALRASEPEPALAKVRARAATAPPRPTNLRAEITSFVGRAGDAAAIRRRLDESRLVTLIGAGGAGKTRLAAHVARSMLDDLPDGCWMVELAPVSEPADLVNAIMAALDLRDASLSRPAGAPRAETGADAVGWLLAHLDGKAALIVLDNCEHLIDHSAALANRILGACPDVRVLATSREPLGVIGESLWPVEPLTLPPADAVWSELDGYESVQLLVSRAAAARPGFAVTEANAPAIGRICRALDGMPLAIELAAARLRVMSPETLADRLQDRFAVLTVGNRAALPRHQTLRAVVDWSWELADDNERALWRRMSVFAGGADLAAATAVCAPSGDVAAGLVALADKSLVTVRDDGSGPRFAMLETIRAYGQLRLDESGERDRVYAAHTAYFAGLAAQARPRLIGHMQLAWFARLHADHDNLQAAVRHAINAHDSVTATAMINDLGWYWWVRGHRHEGVELAEAALALPADVSTRAVRAGACLIAALLAVDGTHELAVAMRWFDAAHDLVLGLDEPMPAMLHLAGPLRTLFSAFYRSEVPMPEESALPVDDADPWVAATALTLRAHMLLNFGRTGPGPAADFERALSIFSDLGERWGMAFSRTSLASLYAWDGRFTEAITHSETALQCLTELGSWDDSIAARVLLSRLLWVSGDHTRAHAEVADAAGDAARYGAPDARAVTAVASAEFARLEGRLADARAALDQAREIVARHTMAGQFHAILVGEYAYLATAEGDLDAARIMHREALDLAVASMDAPVIAQRVVGLADLAQRDGDAEHAAVLFGASEAVRGAADRSSLADGVRLAETLRATLGDAAYEAAHRRGRSLSAAEVDALIGARRPG